MKKNDTFTKIAGYLRVSGFIMAGCVTLSLLLATPARAAGTQVLRGHVPAAVARQHPVGRFPNTNRLNLAIGLPLRNQEALTNLLRQIYNPASTNYHHYLTPEQFTKMFGPTEKDYQAVMAFAKANGLKITGTHPNRMLVDVNGTAGNIERALHVTMRTYQHPHEARVFYAPDVEPTLNLTVPVLNISGLNNYSLPRPRFAATPLANVPPYATPNAGSGPDGAYKGYDFRAAYAPGVTLDGSGQIVGLLQFDGYNAGDIADYESQAGLPSVTLSNVLIDGASGGPSGSGGEVEVSLDIEMAISMAPGLSQVMVYMAPNPSPWEDLLNRMANDNVAKQLSCSWYDPGISANPVTDQIFQQMAAQGQSFFNASGDYDAYTGLIDFPGDNPYLTQVGGTTLSTTGPGGAWASETVWNRHNGIGSGGGISTQYLIPGWQTNINMTTNQGSVTMRNTPDVALTAENVYVRANGMDYNVGGTSCAAPLWAGFAALANQQAATIGKPAIGFINPAVDAIGTGLNYTLAFHDTTTGDNTSSSSPTKFHAVPGYDLCTGWGTPNGLNLINMLAPPVILALPSSATEGDGVLAGAGQIQMPAVQTTDLIVTLASSDSAQVLVPPSVTVPAGQSNAVFDLTILDDGVLDGTQTATITAVAPGYATVGANMSIFDRETAILQASLPASATKGQGTVQGTVQVSAVPAADIVVSLSSSDTTKIQVPTTTTIPLGQTSAVFTATVVDDHQMDGPQTVTVTAHVQNWTDGSTAITVLDNLNLTVTLPSSARENAGVLTNTASVGIAGTLSTDLVVSMLSGNTGKLTVPSTVTIPAGQVSNTFNLTLVDNSIPDGNQTIAVTASASGFMTGSASILILDDESPPIPSNPRPGHLTVNIPANTNLMWNNDTGAELIANGGFETGTFTNWLNENSSEMGDFVINNGSYDPPGPETPTPPFAGGFSVVSEQVGGGTHVIYQDIEFAPGTSSAVLTWTDRIRNFASDFGSSQYFHVEIRDTNDSLIQVAFTTNPGDPLLNDWVTRSFDLSPYIGQTVRVAFVEMDSLYYLNVHLDNVSIRANSFSGTITNDVYFGTNPTPGPAEFQGSTTNSSWPLPLLAPLTTYYWQIVAHRRGTTPSPVWQFTTAGVDHFAWNPVFSPQVVNQPFSATITAQDAFNTTVSNFAGTVMLQAKTGMESYMIEDFESGIWPHSPWVNLNPGIPGTISSSSAHDGFYGLSDPEWTYRTDLQIGNPGDSLSCWVRPGDSRAYLGFGASPNGCLSVVAAPNSGRFIIQQNANFDFNDIVTTNQSWQAGKWYRMEVLFLSNSSVTCNLYDSDGTTLLNSLSLNNVSGLPGGVAMRSFGGFSMDTMTSGGSGGSIPISPAISGNFINGAWTGNITVPQMATNVVLCADDGGGHTGSSNPFAVTVTNDLSIGIAHSPGLASVGASLTYTLTVANTGPSVATAVVATNFLPSDAAFVSATSSQGGCTQTAGMVACNLGVLSGGASATITIVVVPTAPGATLTNVATVSRAEADPFPGNNTAVDTTFVAPGISISEASVLEGNVGPASMIFAVTLSARSAQTISVDYATADDTATAGSDYLGTHGVLSFPPGTTNGTITVTVMGDTLIESNETFFVNLSNPTNATLDRARGVGTIINDDGLPGQTDHFTWSTIPSPQFVDSSFAVTINAQDAFNNPVTNFNGTATLSGAGNHGTVSLIPAITGSFTAGQWTGTMAVNTLDTNVVLTASDGDGHAGNSNPFYTVGPGSTFIPAANRTDMVQDSARGLLYITDGNQVLRYDLNSGMFLSPFVFGSSLCGIDISPDNNTLLVADTDAYNDTNVWVYVVDLPTGTNHQTMFDRDFYEGGTYAIAFGNDGAALISSTFLGFGWTPLRRYDPVSGAVTIVASPCSPSMVSSSGDGRIIGVAEGDTSDGPLDRYDVASQTITGSTGDGWSNFEVGVNRDGSQFAVPTYGGTYVYDTNLNQTALLGSYASEGPIGLAYHPQADLVFFAWWPSSYIRAYETHTMAEVARYDCAYNFDWTGNWAFGQGRLRASRDGNNLFVTVSGGVRWISRLVSPPADLALSLSGAPDPVYAGGNLTYTITLTNYGPNAVNDAKVFDRLPDGVTFVSATSPQGICAQSNGLVSCTLSALPVGTSATISIVVVPVAGGVITNTAAVVSSATDSNPDNNWAAILTTVHMGVLGVTPADALVSSGPVGGPFNPASQTYVLTNSGDAGLVWGANINADWITLSAAGGTLAPGTDTNVTVSINAAAASLARGFYSDTVSFTNLTGSLGSTDCGVTLTVNTAPVALPQTVTLAEDGSSAITLLGTDVDQDALTAVITALPAHGTLYQTSDGINPTTAITQVPTEVSNPAQQVIFVLGQHGYGNDYGDFQFKVNDGLADSADALVSVNVTHVNHPPAAANNTAAFLTGTTQISFNVLINDADVDGDPLTVQSFTSPTRGILTQINNGQFVYQPSSSFTDGQDQFNYTINDGQGGTATAQVTIKTYTRLLDGGDWPTFGNGPSHTGYYPGVLGGAALVPAWSKDFSSALNQVAVGGGNVYITLVTYFGSTYLTALDAVSGQQIWQHNFNTAFSINPPTFDKGRVYVQRGDAGLDTQLWSLDAATGSVIWSAPHTAQWERYYAPTVYGDGIWVDGGYGGGLYGFSTNGEQRFFYNGLAQFDQWTPSYYQGTIYTWVAGSFRAHDPLTGNVHWMLNLNWNWDGYSMNTVPAIDGGMAFIQQRPNLIGIDLAAQTNVWLVGGGVTGSPAAANGIVYAIIGDGVQAFSALDGTSLGGYQATNDTGIAWQPIITDDALFVASSSYTYIFDLASHQLLQTIPYGGKLSLANGRLYIAGQDGWLRVYKIPNVSPAFLSVLPSTGLTASGPAGGPFNPSSQVYSLINNGDASLNWAASKNANWISLSQTNGSLAAGAGINITVGINSNANPLAVGSYLARVTFTNLTHGGGTTNRAVALTVTPPPACTPAPPGLVGWWPAEGNANDVSGTNNGTLVGGMSYGTGEVGQAFFSNSPNGPGVRIPAGPGLNVGASNGFTFEAWINPMDVSRDNPIFEWNLGNGTTYWGVHFHIDPNSFSAGPGALYANIVSTSGNWHQIHTAGGAVTNNGFQHVALTYDKTTGVATIYRNGVIMAQQYLGVFTPLTTYDLYLGRRPLSPPDEQFSFLGLIDEPAVYGRALSSNEIAAIYNAGAGGKCTPLTPVIITQPTSQTVTAGGTANFNVIAGGTAPFSYQWSFNRTNISGATNTTLTLTNVRPSQAGNYAVLVTNVFGSILSSNAMLTVTLDHFGWGIIPSPRFVNTPFAVTIRAQDMTNGIFTNFTGIAFFGTTNGITVTPSVSGNFVQGVWTGAVVISQTASNLVLQADDGLGHFGLANPINVINRPGLEMFRSGNIAVYMWPARYSGFVLETSGNLMPTTWVAVPFSPIQIGDQYLLPLDMMAGTNGYYRLRFPGP